MQPGDWTNTMVTDKASLQKLPPPPNLLTCIASAAVASSKGIKAVIYCNQTGACWFWGKIANHAVGESCWAVRTKIATYGPTSSSLGMSLCFAKAPICLAGGRGRAGSAHPMGGGSWVTGWATIHPKILEKTWFTWSSNATVLSASIFFPWRPTLIVHPGFTTAHRLPCPQDRDHRCHQPPHPPARGTVSVDLLAAGRCTSGLGTWICYEAAGAGGSVGWSRAVPFIIPFIISFIIFYIFSKICTQFLG
jgi:hypothetical protein